MKQKHIILMFILLLLVHRAGAENLSVPLVANTIDYSESTELFKCLRDQGIEMHRLSPILLNNSVKKEKFLIILGGPDAPEGVGVIVSDLLNKSEINDIRKPGRKLFYLRERVWNKQQKILIIAGSTRKETKEAGLLYCQEIANLLLGGSKGELNASIQIEDIGTKYDSAYGAYFLRYVLYSLVNTGSEDFNPTVDISIYSGENYSKLIYSNSQIESNPNNLATNAHWLENFTLNQKLNSRSYLIVLTVRNETNKNVISLDKEAILI